MICSASLENLLFAYVKTKVQISCAVTAQLISAFVFATWTVQSLYFLNPKLQAFSHLLWLYSLVCVRPGSCNMAHMILWRSIKVIIFITIPRFPPFYVRCKLGVYICMERFTILSYNMTHTLIDIHVILHPKLTGHDSMSRLFAYAKTKTQLPRS